MYKKIVILVITLIIIFCSGGWYMHKSQQQMAILVISDSENDLDYPNKRKWFDASRWLSTSQYIKIDDFYLLNLKYHPVDNVNDAGIIVILHFAIRDAIKKFPELLKLSQMDNKEFFHFMQNKLSNEYLRTKFNEDTLEPTDDYFYSFLLIMKYLMRWNYYGKLLIMVLSLCLMDIKLIKKEIGIGGIHLHILILTIATVISGASRKFFSTIDDKLFNLAFTACSRGINNPVRSERV